ncbi:MAG: ABC transporter substrate-binding protein [Betaproteobacteria bacterium]|nr:ABC transporter substrate-binding protein [Betaproteobacteria bacterium]MDH5286107.1 ABC transporter substrate-binding protein [Betaproteobacteria bacterium]
MRAGGGALALGGALRWPGPAAAQSGAGPGTLRVAFSIAETSFDPAFASDAASDSIIANVFDTMLDYDFLARPVKVVPRALEALPVVEDGGRAYVCRLRKGVRFTPDPAFKGAPRELVAEDFAYSFKRHLDPARRSPWAWLLEGKLVGGDEAQEAARRSGRFDYDAKLPGLEVVDRHTLRIRLKAPDYRFAYVLAMPYLCAVAREVVEAYGNDIGAHPVGTGPYLLAEYKRSSRIVLEANPGFRRTTYAPAGPVPAEFAGVAASLKDRPLPLNRRVEISVIEEGQARWLAFLNGEIDVLDSPGVPSEFVEQAVPGGRLKPELAAKGIRHQVLLRPNVYFTYFNMEDPVVGGYTPEKIALRRAIGMGYDVDENIRVLQKGRAAPAHSPIPPGIEGADARKTSAQLHDPAAARALLDRFGYKDRNGDGFREAPDGRPLVLERWSPPTSAQRQADELWKKNMEAIGLRIEFRKEKLPELRKMARLGKIGMRGDGWNGDYPDAENFMQLLYGPNKGQENNARFDLPEFNRLYEAARALPDGRERNALFAKMTDLVLAYAPWRLTVHALEDQLAHRWVRNHVPHPIRSQEWMYFEVVGR